ncbi:MAG: hypothetical protein ACI4WY_05605 [Anaerovoracaceae bacterium]
MCIICRLKNEKEADRLCGAETKEEYEDLQQRANSDRIRKALAGRMAPTRRAVVDKLNRRRRHEE